MQDVCHLGEHSLQYVDDIDLVIIDQLFDFKISIVVWCNVRSQILVHMSGEIFLIGILISILV